MYLVSLLSKLQIELLLDRLVDLTMQYPHSVLKLQFSSDSLEPSCSLEPPVSKP